MFNEYCKHEYNDSTLRKIFDSMEKAEYYIQENSHEAFQSYGRIHNFEIIEKEVA